MGGMNRWDVPRSYETTLSAPEVLVAEPYYRASASRIDRATAAQPQSAALDQLGGYTNEGYIMDIDGQLAQANTDLFPGQSPVGWVRQIAYEAKLARRDPTRQRTRPWPGSPSDVEDVSDPAPHTYSGALDTTIVLNRAIQGDPTLRHEQQGEQ